MKQNWQLTPFNHLVEHPKRPWARFFRSTFGEKCLDTFISFIGKQDKDFYIDTIGISDYLTLGIFLWIHQLFLWTLSEYKNSFQAFALMIPCFILNLASWTIKLIVSGLLTLCCLPVVALAHQLSSWAGGYSLKQDALKLEGLDCSSNEPIPNSISLATFLNEHQRCLSDFEISLTITEPALGNQVLNQVSHYGSKLAKLLYIKNSAPESQNLKAKTQLTFIYYHPEDKPWISNLNFIYSSVFLISMFPWLAAVSAKSMASSATDRATKAIWGRPKDMFIIDVEPDNYEQQQYLTALFKLNVCAVINELFPIEQTSGPTTEVNNASELELNRLRSLCL